jgi:hypothetical protein
LSTRPCTPNGRLWVVIRFSTAASAAAAMARLFCVSVIGVGRAADTQACVLCAVCPGVCVCGGCVKR